MKTKQDISNNTVIFTVKQYLLDLQSRICRFLELEDEHKKFLQTPWQHEQGGGGLTRVLSASAVIEKAGVNFSHVYGKRLPPSAVVGRPELAEKAFQAIGLSVVVHPVNPYVPTSHMNVRFIVVPHSDDNLAWWFGGGFDLTPYYGFEEDCYHWHRMAQAACTPFGLELYTHYKKWADNYFYLPHRREPRGIGGIFFDDVCDGGFDRCFGLMRSVGEHYIKAYQPILARRKQHVFSQRERDFQLYRRGRYVEFNLLYDRGTLFGLQSGGRTESILMSLPPCVTWQYDWQPEAGTPEAKLYEEFLLQKEWV